MPEPFSPCSGLAMNVACMPCWAAITLTTMRNVIRLSAVVSASAWRKSISCWPIATSWCAASRWKPIFCSVSSMSRRQSSPRSTGRDVEVGGGVVRIDGRVAVGVEPEQEELGLRADLHRVAEVGGLLEHPLQVRARIAGERLAVRVGDVADQARGAGVLGAPPGQHRVRCRIRQEVHVRLLDALEAADRRAVEHQLVVERLLQLLDRDRHVLDLAVRLRELQPHEGDVVAPAALEHFLLVHDPPRRSPSAKRRVYRRAGPAKPPTPGSANGPRRRADVRHA